MSEKLSSSKPAVESDEKSKEIAHKSKECSLKEKKKSPKKRTMEIIEMEKEITRPCEITTELTINPEHSEDPEDPEDPRKCQSPKTTSEISTPDKPKDPEDPEDPEVPRKCQSPKTTSEISTPDKPKDPEDPEDPEVPRKCQWPKTTSEISTPDKPKDPEDPEVPKIYELPETTFEISTSIEKDVPKVCQETSGEVSTSIKFKTSEIPDACELPEISSIKFAPPKISKCQLSKIMSEISARFEPYKISDCHVPKTVSEISTSIKSEVPKVPKASQLRKTTSEISTSSKPEDPKIPEVRRTCSSTSEMFTAIKPEASKIPEACQSSKTSEILTSSKPEDSEISKECEMSDSDESLSISDYITSSQTMVRRSPGLPKKLPNETNEKYRIRVVNQMDYFGYFDSELEEKRFLSLTNSGMSIKSHDKSEIPTKPEESSLEDTKSIDDETELMPIISGKRPLNMHNTLWAPISTPNFDEHPLVLATYNLIPSLPISLFEVLAEVIEVVTNKPVVLLHECRLHRPIASQIVDIIVMSAADNWRDGVLLPASFVFEHKLNKDKSANVYADVIVAKDRAPHIKNIMNLRGHKCAVPIQRKNFSASGELFKHLHSKGENMLFFGNILDARTQIDVLEMVANNQADTGVLESPVIECNKYNIPGVNSLHILTTLGPLPPYRIMVKKTLADGLVDNLTDYLLNLHQYEEWLERLTPFGVTGFAENSTDKYEYCDLKGFSKIPYY